MQYEEEKVDTIRKLTIKSLFATPDKIMSMLALKGGNVLNYIYELDERSSIDIDVSMETSFASEGIELSEAEESLKKAFQSTFKMEGFEIIDFNLVEKPDQMPENLEGFWGGYKLIFKVIEQEKLEKLENNGANKSDIRRRTIPLDEKHKKKYIVDISKFEYCKDKQMVEFDDYMIYIYTPLMIVYEKLRALCQQLKEYQDIVETHTLRQRTQDFFDIYIILEKGGFELDPYDKKNLKILKEMFKIKKVPIIFLKKLEDSRETHREGFAAVEDTVSDSDQLKSYDFYFDYVKDLALNIFNRLEKLGIV